MTDSKTTRVNEVIPASEKNKKMLNNQKNKLLVGWCETVSLPDLGITEINAKVDTGAKTSCLHTFKIEEFENEGEKWVKFMIHPIQDDNVTEKECCAKVVDMRTVRDSGGHESFRYVIKTQLVIGHLSYPIEMTLTARDKMVFRMLLGRTAMKGHIMVDPEASFLVQTSQG